MNDFFSSKAPSEFTKTERRIMNYILENPADFIHMSIGEAARRVGTSEPTISRFARHCGYSDFKELKTALLERQEELHSPARKLASSMERPDTSSLEGMLRYQQFCIEKTLSFLNTKDVEDAISAIIKSRRIYIHAKGAALSMAQLLKFRLARFGLSLTILPPGSSELFEEMNFITPEDLLILFGFQNIPREARVLLDYREKTGCPAILFTSRICDFASGDGIIPLYIYRGEPTEYHSMAAPSALLDALVLLTGQRLGSRSKETLDEIFRLKEHYKADIPR